MKANFSQCVLALSLFAPLGWVVYQKTFKPAAADLPIVPAHAKDSLEANKETGKYTETVRKGLAFLAKEQFADGHWEGDGGNHPVAVTGLVGLAFAMNGDRMNVQKAADWLMKHQSPSGLFHSGHDSETSRYMEGHGLATIFLASARRTESDPNRETRLRDAIARAVQYIAKSQSSQGGWYHTSKLEGHDFDAILPTAIQFQALVAAERYGAVPEGTGNNAIAYLIEAFEKAPASLDEKAKPSRAVDAAAALACFNEGSPKDSEGQIAKLFKICESQIPLNDISFNWDDLAHYYYAQALHFHVLRGNSSLRFLEESEVVARYSEYPGVLDFLKRCQNKDGSWPVSQKSTGISSGPVYATALWCTVFQTCEGRHPASPSIRGGGGIEFLR